MEDKKKDFCFFATLSTLLKRKGRDNCICARESLQVGPRHATRRTAMTTFVDEVCEIGKPFWFVNFIMIPSGCRNVCCASSGLGSLNPIDLIFYSYHTILLALIKIV